MFFNPRSVNPQLSMKKSENIHGQSSDFTFHAKIDFLSFFLILNHFFQQMSSNVPMRPEKNDTGSQFER